MKRAWLCALLAGCSGAATVNLGPLPARTGTIIVEGCTLDDQQAGALGSPAAARVAQTVLLRCLAAGPSGLAPAPQLAATVAEVRALGYRADAGFTVDDGSGGVLPPDRVAALLGDGNWRAQLVAQLAALDVDGIEMGLPQLTNDAGAQVTALAGELAAAAHPRLPVAVLLPPSLSSPSDLPGGDAYDVGALASLVDRLRVMTLDYSCCNAPPGPTIEAGWAVDAARFVLGRDSTALVDVAVPLYGNDFSPSGAQTLGYDEAWSLSQYYRAPVTREPSGALHFVYIAASRTHVVWFDDATSTVRTLRAWQPAALPAGVGVAYYGLGAEDPALWGAIARELP
jgi:hypothetical protein